MPDRLRRVVILGFKGVGKSSLTIQFVENHFVDNYNPTIENTFDKVISHKNIEYRLDIVDTAGQDEYSVCPQAYTMNMDGYVLVFSLTSRKSFEVVKVIYEKLLDQTGKKTLPLILVANKSDLSSERQVQPNEVRALANEWKVNYIEASAKDNKNVKHIFQSILEDIDKSEGNTSDKTGCKIM